MNLTGKNAIVTGGAVRVGRAFTLALAEAGCNVLIHYGRSDGPAIETQADAQQFGVQAEIHSANLGDKDALHTVIPKAIDHFGQVDILINSAAIFPETDTFNNSDCDEFDKLMSVNLRAPYLLSRDFAQAQKDNHEGAIINVLDARVRHPETDHFVYRLTKNGLWTMTEMLALELAPSIRVNGVALGAILPPPGKDRSYLDNLAQAHVPLKCAGNAEMVAETAVYLLRQPFITGVVVPIDGGQFLA